MSERSEVARVLTNTHEGFSPANLLNSIERACCHAYDPETDSFDAGQLDIMLCILIPQLREVLRLAGVGVPAYGPHSPSHVVAEAKAAQAEIDDARETKLYRWWDDADLPLYIGIAGDLGSRTKSHVKGSSWMDFVARSAVERFPSRSAALAAEEAAIKAELPIFNKQHNDTPEAHRRLVEYLIERDRLDLLMPAVSRG